MKNSLNKVVIIVAVLATSGLSGCGGNEPSLLEKAEGQLVSAQWVTPVVTVDGVDQSDLYANLAIRFAKGTYTTEGGSPLWEPSGTWVFTNDTASALMLDGNREVQLNELTETTLTLTVQNDNTTFKSGRINSVKGKNVFKLKKK